MIAVDANTVILGAGIGGLGCSLFLLQRGLQIPIFERYDRDKLQSCDQHLIWLAPNGLRLLDELGLYPEVLARSTRQTAMIFANHRFEPLLSISADQLVKSTGYGILAIKRADLHSILWDAVTQRGGMIYSDHHVDHIQLPHTGGHHKCRISFDVNQSRQEYQASYVIAADGIHSTTRQQLFGKGRYHYQKITTWLGQSSTDLAASYQGKTVEAWGQGRRIVMSSLDGETMYWSAMERCSSPDPDHSPIESSIRQRLSRDFASFGDDVTKLLSSRHDVAVRRSHFGVVRGLKSFVNDRVCLLGDAGHGMPPNMGQGASLALEDGFWLACHLASQPPADQVFAGYDRDRMPRVKEMVKLATQMNLMFQPDNRIACQARDLAAQLTPNRLAIEKVRHLYNHDIVSNDSMLTKGLSRSKATPSTTSQVFRSRYPYQHQPLKMSSHLMQGVKWLRASLKWSLKGIAIEPLTYQHVDQASQLLAQEFFHREPLCQTLAIPYDDILRFFKPLVTAMAEAGLSMMAINTKDQVIACVTVEDHHQLFAPDPNKSANRQPSSRLTLIHELLDHHPLPSELAAMTPGTVYQVGLIAVARHSHKALLPSLALATHQHLYTKGYRIGYTKITNPIVVKRLRSLENLLRKRIFDLRSQFYPRHLNFGKNHPFSAHPFPTYLYSWRLA